MENENLEMMRHSLAHILALAVLRTYPEAKFAIGPDVDNGFYYDIDFGEQKIGDADLKELEKKMKHILKQNLPFVRSEKNIDDAISETQSPNEIYKLEILQDLKKEGETKVSFYQLGEFSDLCRGPHVESTSKIKPETFKLNKVAGAYWRGDEKNKMLTRIYGLAFSSPEELKDYMEKMEEAKRRDHKKLGQELDLFSFHQDSPGMVHWHEKGMVLWNELEKFGKKIRKKYGSVEIKTPQMAKSNLWITSGHWDHYKDDMFVFEVDEEDYCLKPMDCPFNINIYKTKPRSYKELPIRYTEIGRVFRNEKSGQLNGLFRVREISQDDSHIFCTKDQISFEIVNLINMVEEYYASFSIKPEYFLSTRPDDFIGEIKDWDIAENDLKVALASKNIEYGLKDKDGAFYGPKIDVNIKDVFGRSWQVATIQLDFQLPGRFDCEYIDSDGTRKAPIMIHAAIFGSFERMIGVLIEHYGGSFPVWLSPVQVKIISVSEKHVDYCQKLKQEFLDLDLRPDLDVDNETVANKIRKAVAEKIPYLIVVGDKEMEGETLAIRRRGEQKIEEIKKDDFVKTIVAESKFVS